MNLNLRAAAALSIVFLSAISTAKVKSKTIIFRVAHGPYEVVNEPLNIFKKEVEEKTNGKLKIQIEIPGSVKDTNTQAVKKTFEDVVSGKVQMSQLYTFYMAKFDPNFHALEIPFLFKDHEHSFAAVDGQPGKQLLASLEKNSPLVGLGFTYCGGYRSVASKNIKIQKIEDLATLKMTYLSPMSQAVFEKMGSSFVANINKEDIPSALLKNEINAYETVSPRYFYNVEYNTAKILNDLNHNIQFTAIVMNKKFFNSLTKKEQDIISEASFKASLIERKLAIQIAEDVRNNARKYGISIVKMPEAEMKKFKDTMDKVDWSIKFGISKDFIETIKNSEPKKLSANEFN
jgi:TRAP-type transport system periplasmic protein